MSAYDPTVSRLGHHLLGYRSQPGVKASMEMDLTKIAQSSKWYEYNYIPTLTQQLCISYTTSDSKPAAGRSKINICLCKLELLNLLTSPTIINPVVQDLTFKWLSVDLSLHGIFYIWVSYLIYIFQTQDSVR
jgi:hypothetical protein